MQHQAYHQHGRHGQQYRAVEQHQQQHHQRIPYQHPQQMENHHQQGHHEITPHDNQPQILPMEHNSDGHVMVSDYHSHPPHNHSHFPLVSVPTYCSHGTTTSANNINNNHHMTNNNEIIHHHHTNHHSYHTNPINHATAGIIDESFPSPHIVNNNIPSFNCSSCPTTNSNFNSPSAMIPTTTVANPKKRKLSMTDIESSTSSSSYPSSSGFIPTSSSYELESIPTRLFMGECIRVKIREIPGILDQFRQMFEQNEVKLQNLTVSFQKEGLFSFQLPCILEGNDCIVFSVPKREVFLPYFQSWDGSMTLHHCAVTISARNLVPNGGDCIMILMHQICCSIVCLETSDMLNFVSKCFSEPKRLKHLLLTVREKYADDFGAMLHTEDEYPLTEPMKSNLKIVKELGKGSNGFVYLVERRKSSNHQNDLWKNSKKLALKQSFSSNPTRVQDYITVHKAMMELSKGETESNVIRIYEIQCVKIEESNTHVSEILMEKCEYDLGRYCRRFFKASLTLKTLESLFQIIKQTVNGIRMIHQAGYCHLDIKEGNIMLNRDKIVKLIDFDFSVANNTSISSKRGTPLYLSPEMVNIKEVSKPIDKSDVWSLGVVILNVVRIMQKLKKFEVAAVASKELLVEDDESILILGNAKEQQSIDVLITKIFDTSQKSLDSQVVNMMTNLESLTRNMLQIGYEKRYSIEDLWNALLNN